MRRVSIVTLPLMSTAVRVLVAVLTVGPPAPDAQPTADPEALSATSAMRALRDAGHEVIHAGGFATGDDVARRLAATCVQEDVDAVVLLGDVPSRLADELRSALAGLDDDGTVVLGPGPELIERVARAVRP